MQGSLVVKILSLNPHSVTPCWVTSGMFLNLSGSPFLMWIKGMIIIWFEKNCWKGVVMGSSTQHSLWHISPPLLVTMSNINRMKWVSQPGVHRWANRVPKGGVVYLRTLSTLGAVAQAPRFPGWCSYLITELWRTLWHSSLTIKAPWWKWVLATLPVASAGDPEAGVWAGLRSYDIGEYSVLRKQFTSSAPNMQGMVLMGFPHLNENVSDTARVPSAPHLKPSFSWGQRWQGVSRETLPCSLYDNNNSPH